MPDTERFRGSETIRYAMGLPVPPPEHAGRVYRNAAEIMLRALRPAGADRPEVER